jgi:hypothetical protein
MTEQQDRRLDAEIGRLMGYHMLGLVPCYQVPECGGWKIPYVSGSGKGLQQLQHLSCFTTWAVYWRFVLEL